MAKQPHFFHSLSGALTCAGVALALSGCAGTPGTSAPPQPDGRQAYSARASQATQPALAQYSLIHAANLPHLAWTLKGQTAALGLNETQRTTLAALAFEVRDQLQPRLEQARAAEQDIAQAALAGATVQQLAERLDRLQTLKREAAQVQIDAARRIRAQLSAAQYAQLRQRAQATLAAAPAPAEYALLLPGHLPHLMPFVARLGASAEHQQSLSRYADEQVRPALRPRLQQARQLEQEIGRAVLDGRSAGELAPQLGRLAQLKREAAEIHLRCIAHVRQTLPPEQYARLVALATAKA
ncbi:MAG TPA: hypothetical protein PLR92_10560 [Alicycliphilus denitrificans]|nr:hypothetical protein [Alicycliphilus denitrificans]